MHHLVEGVIQLLSPKRCAACDEPTEAVFCDACTSLLDPSDVSYAVFRYGGPIADAIHRFKYEGRSDLGAVLGALMAGYACRWKGRFDAVVPVPLHWRRRRTRGFDQAALLATPIARVLEVPARLRGLRRVRHTPSQVDQPYRERQRNVSGAFAARSLHGAHRVLLVDDVRTTGATLAAASDALRKGGVADVGVFVLATRVLERAP